MINVDEVTASRLIFAPMGVFFGKCCGNATLKKVGALNNVRSELLRPAQSQDCKRFLTRRAACTSRGV